MSESVPSRSDAIDPDERTSPAPAGELVPTGEAALVSPGSIEQMAERLRFYESFDELIQQNIARSGQLMREAAVKRDEAVAAIAQTRQQIEAERETQRAALTELLDDVMTIQQATERLAHRVSDALEQIEFELEPVGLKTSESLRGPGSARLPDRTGTRPGLGQSVAEDVDDEYRHGVIGQRPPGMGPGAVSDGNGGFDDRRHIGESTIPSAEEEFASSSGTNPETSAVMGGNIERHDFATPAEQVIGLVGTDPHEPTLGDGPEATPVETSAEVWERSDSASAATSGDDPAAAGANETHPASDEPARDESMEVPSPSTDDASAPADHPTVAVAPVSTTGPGGDPAAVTAVAAAERQTTVVLDGVPRAAIALAIQRHLLAKPDVLRAEVREYYDHRLTLFITAQRPTTASDLEDWDGGAWEQVRSSPELLELRMVM